ncbi:MAG: xanthine dehydrogenase family protein subunit M [Armatimonadota bacterium]|nr:xanthine dehydrogenase family protein subunit M [Armatimonadota bacterium]MDR7427000.1 xanthine dehydrogenase family protein subunit M [Armatimonadota bacterium]MDR7463082.1 xanthine dehydrogenase family protein subunit M [Armatimonadota bacterium]MDR7469335.1 xanthine dehydrogenase family protein subunit M [Armatimonadota bacterium]MDR7475607.1 xanthine dehydrogenase family protein subunit M [Armatimonadota bacterium]
MIPAPFAYHAPASLREALQLLATHGDKARLLAGGHSLLPLMKLRLATPAHLIDLRRIDDLRGIRLEDGRVVVGAMTTHWMIESSDLLRQHIPLLPQTAACIGDLQVRNMGTIGGSLAHADPAADYPAAVLALEAEVVAEGMEGRRRIAAGEFFTGLYATALRPGEILVEVRLPLPPPGSGSAYLKFPHPASGFAVVGVAALVTTDRGGRCTQVRVGVTGVAPVPYRAVAVEEALQGIAPTAEALAAAAAKAAEGVEVNADIFASADYRRHLATVFTRRALQAALQYPQAFGGAG